MYQRNVFHIGIQSSVETAVTLYQLLYQHSLIRLQVSREHLFAATMKLLSPVIISHAFDLVCQYGD
jgi:hypothetical protein